MLAPLHTHCKHKEMPMKKKNLFAIRLVCLLFPLVVANAQVSRSQISARMDGMIFRTIEKAQKNIYDYNGDGKINCIDYSCVFKLTWDADFPTEKYRCTLVRNLQGDVMNHLFVQIQDENSRKIDVEPWASNPKTYLMSENWTSDKYNPYFNYYGETERWLSEGNRPLPKTAAKTTNNQSVSQKAKTASSSQRDTATRQKTAAYSRKSFSKAKSGEGYFSLGYSGSIQSNNSENTTFWNSQKFGIELASESPFDENEIFSIFTFDYLLDHSGERPLDSVLFGFDWGYCLAPLFQPYGGGSLGIKWEEHFSLENIKFAWKVNGGLRASFSTLCVRGDISYSTILGLSGTLAIGWQF